MYGTITGLMRATPSMTRDISTQFKMKGWINITADCRDLEERLINTALEKIRQDPSKNAKLFLEMLKATVGMRDIVNELYSKFCV